MNLYIVVGVSAIIKPEMSKKRTGISLLALGALGVVFGDIGTSPLYALLALFGVGGKHIAITQLNILGVLSLIIWSVVIVVCVKYIGFVMRANNEGEGGIMALVSLVKKSKLSSKYKGLFIILGIVGVSLFYGDSAITPAISVLSAVEGLKVVAPHLHTYVIPITMVVLALLFGIQRYGTGLIGKLFGPVMLVWFVTIGLAGGWQVWHYPTILHALSPLNAVSFFIHEPGIAFIAMAAVVLAITGAEALYADMGHFGRPPIARAWFGVVLPALLLCYMGQGAVLLQNPHAIANPFFHLFPSSLFIPAVVLATLATLIASQSVISGAFSLTRQAVQLGFLPNMLVRHTSDEETGQVYVPLINTILFIAVVVLVVAFGSSSGLANAYGVAISGALLIDTILFIVVVLSLRRVSRLGVVLALLLFLPLDTLFVAANITKVVSGGWFPLVVALIVFIVVTTWIKGQNIIAEERQQIEGPLQALIDKIHDHRAVINRISGHAVYIGHHVGYAPLALHASVDQLKELHEKVVIVIVSIANSPHIAVAKRAKFDGLKYQDDHISYLELTYGYHDVPNVPRSLDAVRSLSPELDFDAASAQYFVSLTKVIPTHKHNIANWRRALYLFMARNKRSSSDHYRLPVSQTIDIEAPIEL